MVILEIEVLNLKILIQLIVIALAVKFLTFLYFFIGDFKNTPVNFQFKELKNEGKILNFFLENNFNYVYYSIHIQFVY